MKLISVILFCFALNVSAVDAKTNLIAKALKVRGNVTVLIPGAMKATKLKEGDMLKKDSSILVNGRGFTKVKFINDSTVTLGPNSKMIVEMDEKKETSLVNLVSGKLRAAVKKDKKNDKKFLVKTNSAVMGVRGTDFQVSYDPKAHRASLLTYEGRVDIKKPKVAEIQTINSKEVKKIDKIKNMLAEDFEPVEKGDFTNVAFNSKKITKPIKINPSQFVLLKKDESLGAEDVKFSKAERKKLAEEVKELNKEFVKEAKARKDNRNIKEMGLIDAKTGFYVPPASSNKLVGKVTTNGEYIPPKGAKIDSAKGLVLEKDAPEETVALVKKVETQIQTQVAPVEIDPRYKRYLLVE